MEGLIVRQVREFPSVKVGCVSIVLDFDVLRIQVIEVKELIELVIASIGNHFQLLVTPNIKRNRSDCTH